MNMERNEDVKVKDAAPAATQDDVSVADIIRGASGLLTGAGILSLTGCTDTGGGSAPKTTATPTADPHANCTDHAAARCGGGAATPPASPPASSVPPATSPTIPIPVTTVGPRTFAILGSGAASVTVATGSHAGHTVWYFAGNAVAGNGFSGNRVLPSPVIEGVQGQNMSITLNSMMAHTIHPHGLDVNTANDGVPDTSGYVGTSMMGFGRIPAGATAFGPTFTYSFTAPFAGTYMYHCHVDTVLHMEMGLYGIVIVRPPDGSLNQVWAGGPTFDKEYIWVLHTMDSAWHSLGMSPVSGSRTVRYRPNVFMINGSTGAALAADTTVAISGAANSRVLVRLANPGYLPAVVEFGGLQFSVIASDGRPLPAAISATTYTVMPGERFDVIITLPAAPGKRNASATYQNIRGSGSWGSATTTVTIA